jgi:putative hemolysin
MGKQFYIIAVVGLILATLALFFLNQVLEDMDDNSPVNSTLANPASAHCEKQGGTVEMRQDRFGTYGVCILQNGTECDEWSYYRGECP